MADLSVNYLGLKLKTPVMAGSSTLTYSKENIEKLNETKAGAIVLKSLFEEELARNSFIQDSFHPESYEYEISDASVLYGSKRYLDLIKDAKKISKIPVFASINCLGGKWWTDFAIECENNGADAIEINISFIPFDYRQNPREVEQKYFDTVNTVKNKIKVPVSVKIGNSFTNIPYMVYQLKEAGADGVVLFNRYYRVSIDLEKMEYMPADVYSKKEEAYTVLRWVSVVSKSIDIDISASTGVDSGEMALKYIAAGAKTVQMVSKLYKDGFGAINKTVNEIDEFLKQKNITDLSDVYNKLKVTDDVNRLERMQYMKIANNQLF